MSDEIDTGPDEAEKEKLPFVPATAQYRNAVYVLPGSAAIDIELFRDDLQEWVPCSLSPYDVEPLYVELFHRVVSEGGIVPFVPKAPLSVDVDLYRDQRIDAGFLFGGVLYQSRPEDRENIAGAAQAAFAAIVGEVEVGDYRWHGGPEDFEWIAADNSRHPMDAQTVFAFGQTALAHKRKHIFAANDLKKLDPIPADFTADQYWP